jgi:hypothetical protein
MAQGLHLRKIVRRRLCASWVFCLNQIAVDAVELLAVMTKVLGEDAGDQTLADATLPLQREVNRRNCGLFGGSAGRSPTLILTIRRVNEHKSFHDFVSHTL